MDPGTDINVLNSEKYRGKWFWSEHKRKDRPLLMQILFILSNGVTRQKVKLLSGISNCRLHVRTVGFDSHLGRNHTLFNCLSIIWWLLVNHKQVAHVKYLGQQMWQSKIARDYLLLAKRKYEGIENFLTDCESREADRAVGCRPERICGRSRVVACSKFLCLEIHYFLPESNSSNKTAQLSEARTSA